MSSGGGRESSEERRPPTTPASPNGSHGAELARPPLSEAKTPYLLYKAFEERRPRIDTTKHAVKTWFGKYRRAPDEAGERVASCEDLLRLVPFTIYDGQY